MTPELTTNPRQHDVIRGFESQSAFSLFLFSLVVSGLATGAGAIAAALLDACSAGACP